jgi:hypothetical protein
MFSLPANGNVGNVVDRNDPESGCYWRDEGLRRRMWYALDNPQNDETLNRLRDIHFLVGQAERRISAHKLIIRLSSSVFETIVGAHEREGLDEVKLPNITPEMFVRLLKVR